MVADVDRSTEHAGVAPIGVYRPAVTVAPSGSCTACTAAAKSGFSIGFEAGHEAVASASVLEHAPSPSTDAEAATTHHHLFFMRRIMPAHNRSVASPADRGERWCRVGCVAFLAPPSH
ncbi:hypothetical protein GS885_23740 [Rhodococcus hoagii]|nr:hypothetical protein [Prescottella equi]